MVEHTKKRVSKACDCCRKSKTKCDGQRPCSRCLADGKICTYMTKKKADRMYPASYVDLLETRVSILVQSLTQLMNRSKESSTQLQQFCNDPQLLNDDGEFDINKVINRLLPREKLDNLAESSADFSLEQITHVTGAADHHSESDSQPQSQSQSPSPSPKHSHSSLSRSLSRASRRNSDNHIHKPSLKKHGAHIGSLSSSATSLSLMNTTTSPISDDSLSSSSLDIFKSAQQAHQSQLLPQHHSLPKRASTLDSMLYPSRIEPLQELDFDGINFSDGSNALMSPVYSIDELDLDTTFGDMFMKQTQQQLPETGVQVKQEWLPNGF